MKFLLKRLLKKHVWKRIFLERLTEPLHLNLLALSVALFGSFRTKVAFDLIVRQHHAFGLLRAADWAKEAGLNEISAIEFGVANGAGILNMCEIARKVRKTTGVKIRIFGFDRGTGLPSPKDYRDHPESYKLGHCPMQDPEKLKNLLKKQDATLLLGEISDQVPKFLRAGFPPIGFISMDVDYYSSTVEALEILQGDHSSYLPWIILYLDDVDGDRNNRFCGELGAIEDFNSLSNRRKIQEFNFLQKERLFQRPYWIEKMYIAHILDHPIRELDLQVAGGYVLDNPYL